MIGTGELAGALQLRVIDGCAVDPPVPVKGTTTEEFSASLRIVRLPVASPTEEGSNRTTAVDDWPGESVTCTGGIEKPTPVTPAVPVTGEFPVFSNVTDNVDAVFSVTLPKDKSEGVTLKVDPEPASGYKFNKNVCEELIPASL